MFHTKQHKDLGKISNQETKFMVHVGMKQIRINYKINK